MQANVVAVGLVWCEGKLLVGRRADNAVLGGTDEFPGGKCELQETPADAVVRECHEETGLKVSVVRCRAVVTHDYPHGRLEIHFFDVVAGPGEPHPPFAWRSIGDVLAGHFPPANKVVLESLEREPYPKPIEVR
jgi:mutator protein MutT